MSLSALSWALAQRDCTLEERALLVLISECHSPHPEACAEVDLDRLGREERIDADQLARLISSLERAQKLVRAEPGLVFLACDAGFRSRADRSGRRT